MRKLVYIGWPSLLRNHSNEASHTWQTILNFSCIYLMNILRTLKAKLDLIWCTLNWILKAPFRCEKHPSCCLSIWTMYLTDRLYKGRTNRHQVCLFVCFLEKKMSYQLGRKMICQNQPVKKKKKKATIHSWKKSHNSHLKNIYSSCPPLKSI